ncbi:MAG: hypothetical protein JWO03_2257 [Bacteroidetes bacterium]|nr:hypothetical protein [Bacteroidota bacterium]
MDLIFDRTALTVLETLGYKYFCTKEEWMPDDGENNYLYWELIPFVTQYEALEYYFDCHKMQVKCHVFIDGDVIDELSQGVPGLVIRIRAVEDVLAC